jgi:hypothetical protein
MSDTETLGSFVRENKKLAREYIDARLEVYRLQLIRSFSKSAGYLLWVVISLVLISLFIVFAGIVTGFWLSELTGSYVKGFGLTTLFILPVIGILTLLRRPLFINPIIRAVINRTMEKSENPEKETEL